MPDQMFAAPLGRAWWIFAVVSCILAGPIAAGVPVTEERVLGLESQVGQAISELQRLSQSERNLIA